jgi:glycosyltransferase involved in cell wall biosynthesis
LPDRPAPGGEEETGVQLASVIVPTRDRLRPLERCLAALERQSYRPLEVLVVDDGGGSDEIAALVTAHGARLVPGPRRGPAAARNAGVRAASGVFVCLTDDDCEPESDWVEWLVRRLRDGADAAAGTTASAGGALADASELAAHAPAGVAPPHGSDVAFAPTNNLGCTRETLDAMPFDESFPDAAGEDREWCARLTGDGRVLAVEPRARIAHRQRLTLIVFLRQQARYGRGAFRFRRRSGPARPFEAAGFYTALLRAGFRQSFAVGLLLTAAQAATAAGYASGWLQSSFLASRAQASPGNGPYGADGD